MILVDYCYFDDSISLLLKDFVGFSNLCQRETVGDERCGVYLALLDELQDFLAVAAIHTSSLEGEVLAVHLWEWKHLSFIIEGNYRNYGIRTGTLPCKLESVVCSSYFKNSVSTTIDTVFDNELLALFGSSQKN